MARRLTAADLGIETGARNMATRRDNGRARFIAAAVEHDGLSETDAGLALDCLLRLKLARIDYGVGAVNVKSGSLLEPATLRAAAADQRAFNAKRARV